MISQKNKRMLRLYLEGNLTDTEKLQFEKELAVNTELSALLEDMNQVEHLLESSAASSTKADLLEPIMNSVWKLGKVYERKQRLQDDQIAAGTWQKTANRIFPTPHWNLAWGFIAGVIVGVAILSFFHPRQPSGGFSEMDATGTFAQKDATGFLILPVDLPAVKLNLAANPLPQSFIQLNLDVSSEENCLVQLSFNTSSFQVWSLRQVGNKPNCQILAGYNYVEIGNLGQNSYIILLKKLTTIEEELSVSIFRDGNLEYNSQVKI